jgi:putative protein kinase ArgK-like GTPase of G3E family
MVRLLEVYGFDVVVIETVGSGQGDTAVREFADVVVLLLQPETGDDLQWEKAGVLEVADVIVIHKADLPGAQNLEAQVSAMLALGSRPPSPVIRVSARTGEGVRLLWETVRSRPLRHRTTGGEHELLRLAQERLAQEYRRAREHGSASVSKLVGQWEAGEISADQAAGELLQLLTKSG